MADALSRTPSLVMLHFPGFMALCCTLKLLLQAPGVELDELDYLRVVLHVLGRISCKYLVKNEGYTYYLLHFV